MSMSFGLGVGLSQSQKLTPQMQQAIKLLQMSSLELEQEVEQKLESNPLLERVDEYDDGDSSISSNLDEWSSSTWQSSSSGDSDGFDAPDFEDSLDKMDDLRMDDGAMDATWQEVYGDDGVDTYHGSGSEEGYEPLGETRLCIQDHVRWQMNFKRLSDLDKLIAEQLIDAMDDMGFVRVTVEEVAHNFATILAFYENLDTIGAEEVLAVLHMIQSCDPIGVGARDLAECLLIQLNALPKDTAYLNEAKLVLKYANFLQSNNIKELVSATQLDLDAIKSAIGLIRTLDPNPGQSFEIANNIAENEKEIPDVLVIAKSKTKARTTDSADTDHWRVMLNPETLPKLQINQEYASLIKRGDESDDNVYLKNHLTDARLFIRSIEERNQNLLKVVTCIVTKQQQFLLKGAMSMQPLVMREVAEAVGLHESTVSRLTTNKSMLTPQGVFPLKYFFSSHIQSDEGEVSSTAISAMIEEMIASENPKKPYSDSQLTKMLEEKGMNIARRTVAKYREALGILSSSERKQKL